MSGPTIEQSIEEYLDECRANGLRPGVITKTYGWPLHSLWLPWCRENDIQDVGQVTQQVVNRFVAWLRERRRADGSLMSPHSIKTYIAVIGRWMAFAHREGQLAAAPRLPRTRVHKEVREVITEEEYVRMQAVVSGERDRLILELLWETGMRSAELLNLRVDDLIQHDRKWFLRVLAPYRGGGAKGGHERLVPLPRYQPLRRYLAGWRAQAEAATDHIFLSQRRDALGRRTALQLTGLEQLIENAAQAAKITHRVYPHLFRHSAITRWLRRGVDPFRISAIVGHSSLAMIQEHYHHLDHVDAYEALAGILVKERR